MSEWLRWMQQIQAISQTGMHFANTPYDKERYEKLLEIAIEIGAKESGLQRDELREIHLRQRGYATPRVDVRAVCFQGEKVLLVREQADGKWSLPGGWADVGDSPSHSATREVWEESGYVCRAEKLIAVYDGNRNAGDLSLYHAYKLVFLCTLTGEFEPQNSPEILEIGFFGPDEIPPLSLNRTWPEILEESFRHQQHPTRQTYFE